MEGFSEMSWFVEGLAVYVSGQFTQEKKQELLKAKRMNLLPAQLIDFWKGRYRYVFAGSMVEYLFHTYGTDKIFHCLQHQDTNAILNDLGINEKELIKQWKEYIE